MKNSIIKKIFCIALLFTSAFALFSCKKLANRSSNVNETKDIFNLEENVKNKKIAVAYFSINDDVKEVADKFVEALDADIYEIVPQVAYTEEDLDFYSNNSRVKLEDEFNPFDNTIDNVDEEYETSEGIFIATISNIEEKKKVKELPKIKSNGANNYQIVVVGFPIWYENAPKVIYTFMQGLKNKVVIPFCTGGEMGQIDQYLSNICDDSVQVMSGKEFNKSTSIEEIKDWVTMLSADFDIH